jgi:hypothetical protein
MDVANIRGVYNVELAEAKARVNNYLSQKKAGAYLIASDYVDVTDTWRCTTIDGVSASK